MKANAAILLTLLFAIGCSDTITGPPPTSTTPGPTRTPAPTATPLPTPNVAGSWSGTFKGFSLGCEGSVETNARAILTQQGSSVGGTISAGCALSTTDFSGALNGNVLSGTMGHSTVTGTATDNRIDAKLDSGFLGPAGQLTLTRNGT